jgi:tetratricopeptide (TPR) repeat protein
MLAAPGGLAPATLLADRFRIVKLLGHGGMGEVYEALDLELGEHVALKTLRAERAGNEEAIEGFRREIQLARKVTHVNVCRTYDLFRHRGPGDAGSPVEFAFVSMELLGGDTLLDRLRTGGRFTTAAAYPIVAQIAAGLAAAHRAGVVHRDLKTANVILVPEQRGRVRAVVTDFGLAHEPARERRGEVDDEWIVGTPTYMAPEQVLGQETSPATDLYALGVVIYEMVTGNVPFPGDTPMSSAIRRLNEPPVPPRVHVPDLDPRWEEVIRRCLERDPADRFASAEDLLHSLAGGRVPPTRRQRRRQAAIAAAVVGALALSGAAVLFARRSPSPVGLAPRPLTIRRSVAVLGFLNVAGRPDSDWLTTALGEMLETELVTSGALRTVPAETVARLKLERGVSDSDQAGVARLRTAVATDVVVLGTHEMRSGEIHLELRAEDAKSGRVLVSASGAGPERDIVEIVARLGDALRRGLGLQALDAQQAAALRAAHVASGDAARLYAEGLARRRAFDARGAKELLVKAIAADPSYSPAHAALADAWAALGYDERAREEARRAKDLAGNLPIEERLRIEARYHEAAREWVEAVEVANKLRELRPDDVEYGLRLAEAQVSAGRPIDALATVASLRRLPAASAGDPRIGMAESRAALAVGDFKRAAQAAAQAADAAAAQGSRLLVARARLLEGSALRPAGDLARAVAAQEEAKRLFAELGDRNGVAQALRQTADVRRYEGNLEEARRVSEEGLKLARASGDQHYVAWAVSRIGSVLQEEGRLKEARQRYEEARAIAPETGDREAEATALNNIGVTLWLEGDLDPARRHIEGCLMFFRQLGQKRGVAFGSFNLGFVLLDQGDVASAQKAFEQALALAREAAQPSLSAMALHGLGNTALVRGDFAEARKRHAEALAIRQSLGEKGRVAESLLALATVAFEEGRSPDVEAKVRESLEAFERARSPQGEALAEALLAQSLLASGDLGGASRASDRARALGATTEYRQPRLVAALTAARVTAAKGRAAEAAQGLRQLLAEAEDSGHVAFALEARLALAEIEEATGAASARERIAALSKDASARGFTLVARRAQALLR